MKICLISNLYPPNIIGGAEVMVEKVAKALARKDNEVIVITTHYNEEKFVETINGVKIYRINPLNVYKMYDHQSKPFFMKPLWHSIDLWNLHAYSALKSILKKEMPDVVHIHNFKGFSLSAFDSVKSLNLPLIFTAHDYSLICMRANLMNGSGDICDASSGLCKVYNKIQGHLVDNKPDVVIAPSKFVIDKLKSNKLFKNVKTVVLPNANESNPIKINKNYDNIDFLYVGALEKHKGPEILIKAFSRIIEKNIKLHIVGKGSEGLKLQELASKDNRIIFHSFLRGNDLKELYKRANVMVIPSIWYDNSPMVIYESFMNSTPVIGSDIGGIPELVQEKYNGFLFKAGDFKELKEIMEYVIKNKAILRRLEQNAYDSSHEYDIENHIKKLETIYRELL